MRLIKYLILGAVLFASCERNDENGDKNRKGTLTVYNSEFSLAGGNIYLYDQPGIFRDSIFEIELYSSGLDLEAQEGTGQLVNIYFSSHTSDNILEGNYDVSGGEAADGSFDCQVFLDHNLETFDFYTEYVPTSGSVILSVTDSIYEITMDIQAEEYFGLVDSMNTGVRVRCQYEGTLFQKDF